METLSHPPPLATAQPLNKKLESQMRLSEEYSDRPQTIAALQRVDPIISCETLTHSDTGQSVFLLGGYYKDSQHRLPVVIFPGIIINNFQPPHPQPDILVERTLADFCRLRDAVYEVAAKDHGMCTYCRAMIRLTLVSATSSQHLSIHEQSQCISLAQSLEELVELSVQTQLAPCCGQVRISQLVCEFLGIVAPTPST